MEEKRSYLTWSLKETSPEVIREKFISLDEWLSNFGETLERSQVRRRGYIFMSRSFFYDGQLAGLDYLERLRESNGVLERVPESLSLQLKPAFDYGLGYEIASRNLLKINMLSPVETKVEEIEELFI